VVSVALVAALWARHQGFQQLFAADSRLFSLGRLTGLVSADLLLIQVFLMARVPWIERSFGQDRLARWHRIIGFTSFNLLVAHVVLATLGHAVSISPSGKLTNPIDEFVILVRTYPGMPMALAGTVALILVVVTSLRAAQRRLRYESWHLLHLYAYIGAGLAVPHELWTGMDFAVSGWATAYWWTAYVVAAGSVVVFRLALPIRRTLRHRLVVDAVVPEGPGVVSIYLRGRRLGRLQMRAGQFCTWRFLSGPGWTRAHPYSISARPGRTWLRITVKDLGDGSAGATRLRPGTRVAFEGPYGRLTYALRQQPRLTMIASGIGVTPLRALAEELRYEPGDATLIYRARTPEDLILRRELDALAHRRGLRVVYLPGRRAHDGAWAPAWHGDDDELLCRIVPDIAEHDLFICGPGEWMHAVEAAALRVGVPQQRLHLESFTR
jgi:predicted ferric reductase